MDDVNTCLDEFGINPETQREGIWFDFLGGIRVRIRRLTYAPYRAEITKQQTRRGFRASNDIDDAALRKAAGRHLIADWNLTETDGTPIPCTFENAMRYLEDTRFDDFYTWLISCAADADAYRATGLESAEGN